MGRWGLSISTKSAAVHLNWPHCSAPRTASSKTNAGPGTKNREITALHAAGQLPARDGTPICNIFFCGRRLAGSQQRCPTPQPSETKAALYFAEPIAIGRLVLFCPQHLPGFQVDKACLRSDQACDQLIRGVVIGHFLDGPSLHGLGGVRAAIEKVVAIK
jgi:hypothetical protein